MQIPVRFCMSFRKPPSAATSRLPEKMDLRRPTIVWWSSSPGATLDSICTYAAFCLTGKPYCLPC